MITAFRTTSLEYLGYPQFAATFMLTIVLHLMAGVAWYMTPHVRIIDIPVRAINIRLGDTDVQQLVEEDEPTPKPDQDNSQKIDDAMTKLIRHQVAEKAIKKAPAPKVIKPLDSPDKIVKPPVYADRNDSPRQFVRFNASVDDKKVGSALGNSENTDAQAKAQYEQTISLWIKKFKLYPDSARSSGVQGRTVVRIRIDRRGNIRYSALEGSTGSIELDRAALDMVRRANPVPAVPDDRIQGEMFEYLIPVNFNFK